MDVPGRLLKCEAESVKYRIATEETDTQVWDEAYWTGLYQVPEKVEPHIRAPLRRLHTAHARGVLGKQRARTEPKDRGELIGQADRICPTVHQHAQVDEERVVGRVIDPSYEVRAARNRAW